MKKTIFALVLTLISAVSILSCNEEEVTPKTKGTGSGSGSAPGSLMPDRIRL